MMLLYSLWPLVRLLERPLVRLPGEASGASDGEASGASTGRGLWCVYWERPLVHPFDKLSDSAEREKVEDNGGGGMFDWRVEGFPPSAPTLTS